MRSKTPEEVACIRQGVESNRLFQYLDDEQKDRLVELCELREYEPGSTIIEEEKIGHSFFVVASGTVIVDQKYCPDAAVEMGRLGPCDSFGEKALFYDTRRSATCRALTHTQCWQVDRKSFHELLVASSQKREVFDKFATLTDPATNERRMRPADFLKCLMPGLDFGNKTDAEVVTEVSHTYPKLATLFNLVDIDKSGSLDFLEFCLFDVIASKPDPFLDFAFLMFDAEKKGFVTRADVERVLEAQGRQFDFSSNVSRRFLGERGDRRLHFKSFCEFFLSLQEELPRQAFARADVHDKGKITGEQFLDLLDNFGHWRMPQPILERVTVMQGLHLTHRGVTYPEFVAFNNLLNHLPGVVAILRHATDHNGGQPVSKSQFLASAQALNSVRPSPLELDIAFRLCDVRGDHTITMEDFLTVTGLHKPPALPLGGDDASHQLSAAGRAKEGAINFLLGSIAGAVGAAVVYPIDFVKTRLQNQPYDSHGRGKHYSGIFDCALKTIRAEGALGMYRGLPAQLVGVSPEKAIKLATNDFLRGLFAREDKRIDLPLEILAGGCAGGMQVFFTNPYELVKIRLQVQGAQAVHNPAFQPKSTLQIIQEMGVGGMYKGASACWLRDIPFSMIYFPTYAHVKKNFKEPLSKTDLLLAGAIAGAPAAYLVTPADVIKTRLQSDAKGAKPRFSGLRDCFFKTWQEEGFKTFFVGGGMRVFRSSPQFAVTLLVYEMLQKAFAPTLHVARPIVNVPISPEEYRSASRYEKVSRAL